MFAAVRIEKPDKPRFVPLLIPFPRHGPAGPGKQSRQDAGSGGPDKPGHDE
jgi:hypothetical protein